MKQFANFRHEDKRTDVTHQAEHHFLYQSYDKNTNDHLTFTFGAIRYHPQI